MQQLAGGQIAAGVPPEALEALSETSVVGAFDPETMTAVRRLVHDCRMLPAWDKLAAAAAVDGGYMLSLHWAKSFVISAGAALQSTRDADPWDCMTTAERHAWMSRMEACVSTFCDLASTGPVKPRAMPFKVLRSVLEELGVRLRSPLRDGTFANDVPGAVDLYAAQDIGNDDRWLLMDALKDYSTECRRAAGHAQHLKKPRDAKARRARFIVELSGHLASKFGAPLQEVIAIAGEVMLDDPSITVRLVRRLTTGK